MAAPTIREAPSSRLSAGGGVVTRTMAATVWLTVFLALSWAAYRTIGWLSRVADCERRCCAPPGHSCFDGRQ